jgi:molybdenum cofactor synthesis domain-containing protein
MLMFRKLLSLDEARQVINKHFVPKPLGVEEVPLLEAHGRVLAENIVAPMDIPPFDRSTVDGYAVKTKDTYGAEENKPVKLKICGTVNVGEMPMIIVEQGEAAEIVTGAPIPKGADAIVMIEYTERKNDDVYVYKAVAKDENIMKAGSDIKKGEEILKTGQLLSSSEIGVLAALGLAKIKVYVVPRVAVLSTGAEVTEPGRKMLQGKIYDINAYSISGVVRESGAKPIYLGVISDEATELRKALRNVLESADMVVTSGGVSVGPKDLLPQTLDALGKPGVVVCGIAVKPGKPTTVAVINEKIVFSLPGHPTSALLMFQLLVRPILQKMAGMEARKPFEVKAFVTMRMFSAKGRRTFIMVKLRHDKTNPLLAEPVQEGLSGAITTLAKADGFIEIPENQQFVDAGEEVTVHILKLWK